MADSVFNRAKGRGTEWAERINGNDPANSVLVIMALDSSGLESHATLIDVDTFTAVVAGTTNEATNTDYARKSIDNTGSITITYDDTNNRVDVDIPDQTWTGVDAGNAWGALVTGYDSDSTAGTDANILPWTLHDFAVTPDGSDITAQVANFYRAS